MLSIIDALSARALLKVNMFTQRRQLYADMSCGLLVLLMALVLREVPGLLRIASVVVSEQEGEHLRRVPFGIQLSQQRDTYLESRSMDVTAISYYNDLAADKKIMAVTYAVNLYHNEDYAVLHNAGVTLLITL